MSVNVPGIFRGNPNYHSNVSQAWPFENAHDVKHVWENVMCSTCQVYLEAKAVVRLLRSR